jgi:PAS domain S-box-containing protein
MTRVDMQQPSAEPVETPGAALRSDIFRSIFDASPYAILIADDTGRYVQANRVACQLFGHSRQDLLGKQVTDFVEAAEVTPILDSWNDFRAQKQQTGHFRLVRPDGSRRILRYHAVADFAPGLHLSFLEDATEAVASAAARDAAEAERDRVFQISTDIIAVIDPQRRFRRVNPAIWTTLGQEPAQVLGRDYLELVHPEDAPAVLEARRLVGEQGSIVAAPIRFLHRDGGYRWIAWSSTNFDGDHYVVGRDVTREQETRTALERSEARLRSLAEEQERSIGQLRLEQDMRERFVAALSHDLRSPLTAAKMGAQLILGRADQPEACQTYASRIIRNVDHADRLIQNVLDASRISAGEALPIQRVSCDVRGLVADVLADQMTIHGHRFVLEAPAPVVGLCDPATVRRTLENLLGNAIKYGSPHAPVTVRVEDRDAEIVLAVHNEGAPIAAADQARIFQPYQRVQSQGGGSPKGWGLGLTLVRSMAQAHGGSVRVNSSAEHGTTFIVTLRKD